MIILGLIGILALVLGILHFVNPVAICKIDEVGKKIVVTMDKMVKKYPRRLGVFYIAAAVLLIYIGFLRR